MGLFEAILIQITFVDMRMKWYNTGHLELLALITQGFVVFSLIHKIIHCIYIYIYDACADIDI